MSDSADPISVRAYARHRGCSAPAVLQAIRKGRLRLSLVYDAGGKAKIADVELADREWTQNTDRSRTIVSSAARASAAPPASIQATVKPQGQQRLRDEPPPDRKPARPGDAAPMLDPEERWNVVDATAEERKWKALQAEAKYKRDIGELVSAKDVEFAQAALFTIIRTKLLAVPGKARSNAPHLTLTDVALIDRLIRETLEELAESEPPAPPDASDDAGATSGAAA